MSWGSGSLSPALRHSNAKLDEAQLSPIESSTQRQGLDTSHDSISTISSMSPVTTFRHFQSESWGARISKNSNKGPINTVPSWPPPIEMTLDDESNPTKLFMDEEENDANNECNGDLTLSGTRLNFNSLLSPVVGGRKREETTPITDGKCQLKRTLAVDVTHTYDQVSFTSPWPSMSSRTTEHVHHEDSADNFLLTPGTTCLKPGALLEKQSLNASAMTAQEHFQCQLESSQCSPIYHTDSCASSSVSRRPSIIGGTVTSTPSSRTSNMGSRQSQEAEYISTHFSPLLDYASQFSCGSKHSNQGVNNTLNSNLSSSHVSTDSVNSRTARPMPDMTAFEGNPSSLKSINDESRSSSTPSAASKPKIVCPPTPARTPAWALNDCLIPAIKRMDSLRSTKVLISCPAEVMRKVNNWEKKRDIHVECENTLPGLTVNQMGRERMFRPLFDDRICNIPMSTAKKKIQYQDAARIIGDDQLLKQANGMLNKSTGEVGSVISFNSNFESLGQLGSGAFADVYKARCKIDNCVYAVKRNRRQFRSKRDREMALTEVRTMQRLQESTKCANGENADFCPFLLQFIRAWQEDGFFFCQTELCCRDNCRNMVMSLRGNWSFAKKNYPSLSRNLTEYCDENQNGRVVPESSIWKICHDLISGLVYIHLHGIVHYDIKPSNIFFVSDDRLGCICKIGDFGLAGEINSIEDGREGDAVYMPLELLSSGTKQSSADIFSLGITLYELAADVTFELPAEGPHWHDIRNASHVPVLPKCRSKELSRLIKSMINPNVSKRLSAKSILSEIAEVKSIGGLFDKFLAEYVSDVEGFDEKRERMMAEAQKVARDRRFTPTGATLKKHVNGMESERLWNVGTPTW